MMMNRPPSLSAKRQLTRRMVVFGGVQAIGLSALAARLYQLQFLKAEEYRTQAEGNRIKIRLIAPPRGLINDCNGAPLADNQINYRLMLERENIAQAKKSLEKLSQMLGFSKETLTYRMDEIGKYPNPAPILVKQYLDWDEVAKVQFHIPDLPGVRVEEGKVRNYPLGELAAHVIGYVGRVSEKEMRPDMPVQKLPEFKIGKDGFEVMFNEELQGSAGSRRVEVDASSRIVRQLATLPPEQGAEHTLTLDHRLQRYASERLKGESGAIVVLDTLTGGIKCLVSMPAYDPNSFSMGITNTYYQELRNNKKTPLLNKAIAGQYPPGSTFKMLVGLAALEEGIMTPEKTVYCPGHFYLGRSRWNCWKQQGHGAMNYADAIAQSCDTYFYTVAKELGIEKIAAIAHKLGLGERLSPNIPNEKTGIIPTPDWKRKSYDERWNPGDTINAAIGQGYVLSTPMQLAVMAARLATGKHIMPNIVQETANQAAKSFEQLDLKKEHVEQAQKAMAKAVMHERGTAYWKKIGSIEHEMAGKTGTSQVRKITERGQDQSELPWEMRHHGLFVGYAPFDNPRYAMSVIVEHGGGGASAAAPIARDVLAKMQELDAADAGAPVTLLKEES